MKHLQTKAIRTRSEKTHYQEHSTPLFLTSSFTFNDAEQMRARFAEEEEGNLYSRFSNPNTSELIDKICALEGAEDAWATATGMSAVFTALAAITKTGDHIISTRQIFGSTHQLFQQVFPKWNINSSYVDLDRHESWDTAVKPNSKIFYLETPSNPAVALCDLSEAKKFCKRHNLLLIVDNCFATPIIQRPIEYGADLVIHSATKFMDGQGRVLGGLIAGSQSLINEVRFFARHSGPAMSPFNAWVLSKSFETLSLRMERHSSNALEIASRIEQHPAISKVLYPFLESHPQYQLAKKQMDLGGGILSIELAAGLEGGKQFLNKLQMCSISANLGDSRTICTHPASTTHAKLSKEDREAAGISDGLVRVSCGLEHVEDIWSDLEQALTF